MKPITIVRLILLVSFALTASPQVQSQRKKVTMVSFNAPDAGSLPGQGSFVNGISVTGSVVGWYVDANNVNHGLLRTEDGALIEFDAPGAGTGAGQGTIGYGMNAMEAVTGYYADASNTVHGFLRSPDGRFSTFDAPHAGTEAGSTGCLAQFTCQGTFAANINSAGEISGRYKDVTGVHHGFVRDKHGNIIEFDAPGACAGPGQGTVTSSFYGLNNRGWFAGPYIDCGNVYHGYLRAPDGTIITFDAPDAGTGAGQGTLAACVNADMKIAGWFIDANSVNHGFVRGSDGPFRSIDAPGAGTGAGQGTLVAAVTPAGLVAGFYVDANNVAHGFSHDASGDFTVLDAPGAGIGAGQGTYAVGNNIRGEITGYFVDNNNVAHGFVRCSRKGVTKWTEPPY